VVSSSFYNSQLAVIILMIGSLKTVFLCGIWAGFNLFQKKIFFRLFGPVFPDKIPKSFFFFLSEVAISNTIFKL
jgi:hypothetical protein